MSGALVLRMPSQYFDSESGHFYNTYRTLMPGQGRYTQNDPIGLDGGWNRMGYVGGNSLSFTDPLGLKKIILLPPDDANYPAALNYPDDPTKCIVIAHGSTQSVNRMNARQLDKLLTQSGCKKEPVRIDACRTGQGDNSIAEQLSRIRGVTVVAPTELTWTTPWGGNFSSPYPPMSEDRDSFLNTVPNFTRPGDWRQFDPPSRGRK
jgi:RHS repeat-associated protein